MAVRQVWGVNAAMGGVDDDGGDAIGRKTLGDQGPPTFFTLGLGMYMCMYMYIYELGKRLLQCVLCNLSM
jgi:hypothetical protein